MSPAAEPPSEPSVVATEMCWFGRRDRAAETYY
jgi:hypothetical protein